MGEYKELSTNNKDEEQDFQIVIEEVEGEEANKDLENQIDKDEGKGEETPAPKKKEVEDEAPRKPSRAEKRIKELHTSNKEKDARLAQMAEELENLKKNQSESTKITKEDLRGTLEASIENLNGRLIKAMEEGDTATTVAVQNELLKTSNKLHDLNKELDSYKPYEPKKLQQEQQHKVSEKAVEWIEAHPAFRTDEVFQAAALAVNQKLIMDGWDADSDEFYEEVTARLEKRFPDVFGIEDSNGVKSKDKEESSDEDKTKNKSQRHTEQTVSGASRTPSTTSDGKPSNSKKSTITLTQEDIRLAKRWNMTPEQFAKRKLALQNKERGTYIEINTNA